MLERDIEKHLVRRVEAIGGKAYKFTSPNHRSVPDRLVLIPARTRDDGLECAWCNPRGLTVFVELKAPGKKPTAPQLREHAKLRALGHRVEVIDSMERVDFFVEGLSRG